LILFLSCDLFLLFLLIFFIMWLLFPLIFFNRVTYFSFFPWFFQLCDLIGDNCIVFENFTASIGGVNCEFDGCKYLFYWLRFASTVKLHLRPSNPQLTPPTLKIQYCYSYSYVILPTSDLYILRCYPSLS
jgi:hypothetical protein